MKKMEYRTLKALNLVRDYTILNYYEDDDGEIYVVYADRAVNADGTVGVHVVRFDPVLEVTACDSVNPELEREVIRKLLDQQTKALFSEWGEKDRIAAAQELLHDLNLKESSFQFTMTALERKMLRKRLEHILTLQSVVSSDDEDEKPV